MKANEILQVVYSFFLGVAVVSFFGVGLSTFYPSPQQNDDDWETYQVVYDAWATNTSILLLVFAIITLVLSLIRAERYLVIANGLLLGGIFTLLYAVTMTFYATQSTMRFFVVTVALVVAIGVGWLKFVRRGSRLVQPTPVPLMAVPAGEAAPEGYYDALSVRVDSIERRLKRIAGALAEGDPQP